MISLALAVFWISLGLLGWTFAGYALCMRLLARGRPAHAAAGWPPGVATIVLVVHNEAARLPGRLANLLATAWPAERLRLVVVSDGSSDETAALARAAGAERLTVLEWPERRGKTHGLNAALAVAEGDYLVFADARQRFEPETIPRLLAHFSDPRVGAVSGSLEIESARSGLGRGIDLYWKGEKALRAAEACVDSCIGCTGAVYAIRRALAEPLPPDTLLDDVVIPMRIALRGYRVLHDEEARAFDPQPLEPEAERRRKLRTLAGNFQMLFRYPAWLLPWRNRLWLRLVSHKYLRLAAPFLLVGLFVANAALASLPAYRALLFGQAAFYTLALAGPLFSSRWLSLPGSFVLLNLAVLRAFFAWLRGRHGETWQPRR